MPSKSRQKLDRSEPADLGDRGGSPAWGWIALGLGGVTASALLLEIVVTRVFSVVLASHFAFMAVSMALFGIGLAGIVVYLYPERFRASHIASTTSRLALLFALATALCLPLFDLFVSSTKAWPLPFASVLTVFLIILPPFFFGGLAVAVPITRGTERIGLLYGADLIGAALGAALAIPTLGWLGGPVSILACALLACLSALCLAHAAGSARRRRNATVATAACALALGIAASTDVFSLQHSRSGPEHTLRFQKWNSFSRISVWGPLDHGSMWRVGRGAPLPGLDLQTGKRRSTHYSIAIDGGAQTPMAIFEGDFRRVEYFKYDITSLGYQLRSPEKVLIIGAGGGRDILTARLLGVDSIRAVEINPLVVDVSRKYFREASGSPYDLPGVEVSLRDGRSFAAESTESFDVIQLSAVDTFAASGGGALALVEHTLYTIEAFQDYYDRLSEDGVISMTHKWGVPAPERALRAVDLVREAWSRRGVQDPGQHIVVLGRHLAWGTMLASRSPFSAQDLAKIREMAERLGFGVLYARGDAGSLREIVQLLGPDPDALLESYPKDVRATSDDRPFFFYFEKPLDSLLGRRIDTPLTEGEAPTTLPRLFVALLVLSTALMFVLPLLLGRMRLGETRGAGRGLLYFACIGLGFIMIEIPLIQRFNLLLGQPLYAFAVVLGSMLIFSGIGSMISGRVSDEGLGRVIPTLLGVIVVVSLVHLFLAPRIIYAGLHLALPVRIALAIAAIAPLGLLMGMPLPLGMRMLERSVPVAIPWGWAINGSLSVIGTVLAMMVSVAFGMTWTILIGISAYTLACATQLRRPA